MDNTQLKCFITVAQTLNFSEAAKLNFVSQSTISRYIKDLEKEFGVKLFERTKREVALTNEGKMLLPYAIEILETLNKANTIISQINSGCGGKISIAYDAVSGGFIAEILRKFSNKYPQITIELIQITDINEKILNSADYDFYFMPRDLFPDSDKLNSMITHTDTLSFIVSSEDDSDINKIKHDKFILLSENVNPILYMEIMDIFRTFHFSPDSISTADDVNSLITMVKADMGVSVLPTSVISLYSDKGIKVIDYDDVDTDIEFVVGWRKDLTNPVAHLFSEVIADMVDNDYEDEFVL